MSRLRRHWMVACIAVLLSVFAWLPVLKTASIEQSEKGLQRALAVFATARTVNAVLSVVQESQVSLQPAGVGAQIAVGQFLDPINDLVEQLSSVMLMASVAFGVQILLIKIGAHSFVAMGLTVAVAACLAMQLWRGSCPAWLLRLSVLLVLVRFAVPAYALASEAIYDGFLSTEYSESHGELKRSEESLRAAERAASTDLPASAPASEKSKAFYRRWFDSMKIDLPDMPNIPDLRQLKQEVEKMTENTVKRMVDLMKVFAVQTVLLPLIFLWLLRAACGSLLTAPGAQAPASRRGERQGVEA